MRETRRRISYALGGAVLAAGSLLVPGAAVATAAEVCSTTGTTTTCTYTYSGGEQTFTVPDRVTSLQVIAVGASGGVAPAPPATPVNTPSSGAQVSGTLTVSPNQVLYVEVGGAAFGDNKCNRRTECHGGFNGGGSSLRPAGGGGGASDVRKSSAAVGTSSLASRLIVAGGGGGDAAPDGGCLFNPDLPAGTGGNAGAPGGPGQLCPGGITGSSTGGGAGTATAGGAGGTTVVNENVMATGVAGALGVGADPGLGGGSAGAGGGGLWGGGSGADFVHDPTGHTAISASGGGGGSSLIPANGQSGLANGPAKVTITYTQPPPVGGAPDQLTALGQAVAGIGLGTSLAQKVTTAQQNLARGDTAGACGALTGFVNQVEAQSGKKIPVATATQLVASAHGIQAAIRC